MVSVLRPTRRPAVSLAAAAALPAASLALASRLREPRRTQPRAAVTA